MNSITRLLRGYFTGHRGDYQLTPCDKPTLNDVESAGLYLHVPYCSSLCPYCPYHKVPYHADSVKQYFISVCKEIELIAAALPAHFRSTSLYIGGGTPTLCMEGLEQVIPAMRSKLNLQGDICIETGPNACDSAVIDRLHKLHVSMVSIGIQTFNEGLLKYLGRRDNPSRLEGVIQQLLAARFDSVNLDFIFAMPGQTDRDLYADLEKAVQLGAQQITLYPLFSFPYSSIQNYQRLRHVMPPKLRQERRQFHLIRTFFEQAGFVRSSIWSFRKASAKRYSSATREQYIGLGSGAGSCLPSGFYLNTFDIDSYHTRLQSGFFPTSLVLPFSQAMHQYFWLYWRLYDTSVSKEAFWKMLNPSDFKIRGLLWILKTLGILTQTDDHYQLKDRGAFWVHLLQNRTLLNYINTVWTQAKKNPFPDLIRF